jgi:hypothetical protein
MMVLPAFGVARSPIVQRLPERARVSTVYLIGGVAAYWSWARIAAILL